MSLLDEAARTLVAPPQKKGPCQNGQSGAVQKFPVHDSCLLFLMVLSLSVRGSPHSPRTGVNPARRSCTSPRLLHRFPGLCHPASDLPRDLPRVTGAGPGSGLHGVPSFFPKEPACRSGKTAVSCRCQGLAPLLRYSRRSTRRLPGYPGRTGSSPCRRTCPRHA